MAEELHIIETENKVEIYKSLLPQLKELISFETDIVANLANISAALHQTFKWFWVGFYIVKNEELVLGPFQGTIACTRIKKGKGVCGTSWEQKKSLLVPDVDKFPGHIACSSLSVSEIVIPVFDKNNEVIAILDIDSDKFDILDETDVVYLQQISSVITDIWK